MIRNEEDIDLRKHKKNKTRAKLERKQRNLLKEIARGKNVTTTQMKQSLKMSV